MPKTRQCYEKHQGACFCPEAPKYRKIVRGYTAQARFYAANLARENDEWRQLGFIPNGGGSKPVFEMLNGTAIAIYDGSDHLSVIIQEVERTAILPTEEQCWQTAGVR